MMADVGVVYLHWDRGGWLYFRPGDSGGLPCSEQTVHGYG